MNDKLHPQGTKVEFEINKKIYTGVIQGICREDFPMLGRSYIIKLEHYSDPIYPYTHCVMFENLLSIIPEKSCSDCCDPS